MRIEDYLDSLPKSIITGEEVSLQDDTLKEIFRFASLGKDDVFYHLGCGDGHGVAVALDEFSVKRAVGIDHSKDKISAAKEMLAGKKTSNWEMRCENVLDSDIRDATVVLFWFSDPEIVEKMSSKFATLARGCRIITIWGPLPGNLPDKVDFPYIMNTVPFRQASSLADQAMAIFGTDCIDFVTAWEYAERYSKAIASKDADHDRFLTILQTMIIWINAKNLGIACGDEIPVPVKNYFGILKTYFNIEMEHLLNQGTK